jgi:copper transport protein
MAAWPTAAPVLAHGEVVESVPAPGAVLAAAPAEIVVTLSNPVTDASTIDVLDAGFQKVDTGPLRRDPAVPGRVAVAVDLLPPGDYTVQWSAIDAVDGHKTQGSFVFSVHEATEGTGIADGTASTDEAGGMLASLPGAVWWGWIVVIMGGGVGLWLARRSQSKGETE